MKALLMAFSYLYFITASYASENIVLAKKHQLKSIILDEQRSYSVYFEDKIHGTVAAFG